MRFRAMSAVKTGKITLVPKIGYFYELAFLTGVRVIAIPYQRASTKRFRYCHEAHCTLYDVMTRTNFELL